MNNILMPPEPDDKIEAFSLNPDQRQFVDLMEYQFAEDVFKIWHTTVPRISVLVPAQPYRMTILVTSENAASVSKDFELVETSEGSTYWELKELNV